MGSLPEGAPLAEQLLGRFGGDGLIPLGAIPLVFAQKQDLSRNRIWHILLMTEQFPTGLWYQDGVFATWCRHP